ncbi:MAG: aminotransferase class III-fold pyridoxal phosphate-dependent enzyme, partial [Aureliella sp.]
GFRVSLGGAQELFGITPDLTTMGKIVGGGLPLGLYGGRADLMDQVIPAGKVYQAGTLSGNPLATAAGAATLRCLLDESPYAHLEQLGQQLAAGLDKAASRAGIAHKVQRVGSMLTLFFCDQPVTGWKQANTCDRARFGRYFWRLIERGIYMPCSQFEALFISATHTPQIIDQTIDAAEQVLATGLAGV